MCFYLYFNLAISRRKSQELEHAHKERHWVRIIYRNYLSLAVMASKLFSYCQKRLSIIAVSHNVSSTAQMLTVLVIFNPRLEQIFLFLHNAPDLRLMLSNMMVILENNPSCSCKDRGKQTRRTYGHFGF